MNENGHKTRKVNKGAPSGLVFSLIVHTAVFFLAGLLVVFRVMTMPDAQFEVPESIERPKMKLKKPKVKVKKSSQPKPSSRIVAKVKTRDMPEIQLPDLAGVGEGLLGGTGVGENFLDLPEISEVSLFGGQVTSGADLEVTFYCMAKDRDGTPNYGMDHPEYFALLRKFVLSGWNTKLFDRYYRSPTRLYATSIFIPTVPSALGPHAFGEDMDYGYCWVAHYKGKLVHKDGITFRFWGAADDVLTVAVDGEVVLAANYTWDGIDAHTIADHWVSRAPNDRVFRLGNQRRTGSEWITLEPGVAHDFQAIAGEGPGGGFHAELLVEVQGEEYPLNDQGGRIFPAFATEPIPRSVQDSILMNLAEGEANVTNVTTFFNDF